MSQNPSPFLAPPFKQCAVVVEDLDQAVRRWADLLGIGPWTGYRLDPDPRSLDELYDH